LCWVFVWVVCGVGFWWGGGVWGGGGGGGGGRE